MAMAVLTRSQYTLRSASMTCGASVQIRDYEQFGKKSRFELVAPQSGNPRGIANRK